MASSVCFPLHYPTVTSMATTLLGASYALLHLLLTAALGSSHCYCPHFTGKKMEAQSGHLTCPRLTKLRGGGTFLTWVQALMYATLPPTGKLWVGQLSSRGQQWWTQLQSTLSSSRITADQYSSPPRNVLKHPLCVLLSSKGTEVNETWSSSSEIPSSEDDFHSHKGQEQHICHLHLNYKRASCFLGWKALYKNTGHTVSRGGYSSIGREEA